MQDFTAYIALGDSMSIDLYPALDLARATESPLGAASLLYRNESIIWPEFTGKDLVTHTPDLSFLNLAEDGATTWDLLDGTCLATLADYASQQILITLTLGGNDALQMLRLPPEEPSQLVSETSGIVTRYKEVVDQLCNAFSSATIIVTSIYDPSDGTGEIPSLPSFADKLPFLRYINDQIKETAARHQLIYADVHSRFFGHGMKVSPEKRYYWEPSPIEPSALGASELRKLWLELLDLT